jgi:DNA-binding NarL/FixJ family response regulator
MPVMDGAECFKALKKIDPALPVIISSGFANDGQTEKLISEGADGLLPKPYDMDQLVDLFSTVRPR